MYKTLGIETQILETTNEAILLHRLLEIAKEAGYTHVQDHWGHNAYDEYTIDEALARFKATKDLLLDNDNGGIVIPPIDADPDYMDSHTTTNARSFEEDDDRLRKVIKDFATREADDLFNEDIIRDIEEQQGDEDYGGHW